jgi:hypothetical protein
MARAWTDLAARIEKLGHPDQPAIRAAEPPSRPPGPEPPNQG